MTQITIDWMESFREGALQFGFYYHQTPGSNVEEIRVLVPFLTPKLQIVKVFELVGV